MIVELAFGSGTLPVEMPDGRTTVVEPSYPPAAVDERAAVVSALRNPIAGPPLRAILRPGQTVAISICDVTRAQPRRLVVPAILDELVGTVRLEDVVIRDGPWHTGTEHQYPETCVDELDVEAPRG